MSALRWHDNKTSHLESESQQWNHDALLYRGQNSFQYSGAS
jgi:hypothetical protein